SPPLVQIAPAAAPPASDKKDKEPKKGPPVPDQSPNDPVVQSSPGAAAAPALGLGFEGVGQGFTGPSGTFAVSSAPPGPNSAVGPDAYCTTFNMFRNGQTFVGPEIGAFDRAKMLLGQPATQQCFALSTAYGGLLPSDLDGTAPPPGGAPNYVLGFGTNSLLLW